MNLERGTEGYSNLMGAAEDLERACLRLSSAAQEVAGAPERELAAAAAAHLEEARAVGGEIERTLRTLDATRRRAAPLPGPVREAANARLAASRRAVNEAGGAYARLAERVRRLRSEAESALQQMRHGERALARYGATAREARRAAGGV